MADADKLRLRMASLCSRSEQCSFDIRQKLRKAGLPSGQSEEIVRFLQDEKFLDDARFARAYANDKVRFSAWGRLKIHAALAAKRIPSNLITEALDSIDDEEYAEALERAARAKARDLDLEVREDVAKLYRHLLSRGFESGMVSKEVRKLGR